MDKHSFTLYKQSPTSYKKVVEVFDGEGTIHTVSVDELVFRPSVYGLLRKGNELLVQSNPALQGYSLPGGAIDKGEDEKDALKREFKEETGLIVEIKDLIEVKTDYFTYGGNFYHCLLVFYSVEEVGGALITESNGDDSEEALYISIEELKSRKIQRVFKSIIEKLASY